MMKQFVNAYLTSNEDSLKRLIWADWLEEQGDVRCENLRTYQAIIEDVEEFDKAYAENQPVSDCYNVKVFRNNLKNLTVCAFMRCFKNTFMTECFAQHGEGHCISEETGSVCFHSSTRPHACTKDYSTKRFIKLLNLTELKILMNENNIKTVKIKNHRCSCLQSLIGRMALLKNIEFENVFDNLYWQNDEKYRIKLRKTMLYITDLIGTKYHGA